MPSTHDSLNLVFNAMLLQSASFAHYIQKNNILVKLLDVLPNCSQDS